MAQFGSGIALYLTIKVEVVVEEDSEMIRARLGGELRERWKKLLDDRQISQQRAIVAAIEFLCEQDPLTQAMIFKQVPGTDRTELARIVLRRLADQKRRK